jgi:hypothetical protein
MKNQIRLLAVFVLLVSVASATDLTGTIKDPRSPGNPFAGTVRLSLSYSGARQISTNTSIVPSPVDIRVINGSLSPSPVGIIGNDDISPSRTSYYAQYFNTAGVEVLRTNYYISGTTYDLGSAVPTPVTTSNISFMDLIGLRTITAKTIGGVAYTNQFSSIQAAIDFLAGPGTVELPIGVVTIGSNAACAVTLPDGVILKGQGARTSLFQAAFGDPAWPTALSGSVIKFTGNSTGICMTGPTATHTVIRDLGLVGPGSGTSAGIKVSAGALASHIENVVIANFSKCLLYDDTYGNTFSNVFTLGCTDGIYSGPGILNASQFHNWWASGNTRAGTLTAAQGVSFTGRRTIIQANAAGILLNPAGAGFKNISFEDTWFESNGPYDVTFNTTTSSISHVYMRTHHGNGGNMIQFTGANSIGFFEFEQMDAGGVTLTLPAAPQLCATFRNAVFASVTDNGLCSTWFNDNQYGAGLTLSNATPMLKDTSGVSLLTINTPDVWMGRFGSTSLRHFNIWQTGNFRQFSSNGATLYWEQGASGYNLYGINLTLHTAAGVQKAQIVGATGDATLSGSVDASKHCIAGVTVCWTTTAGAPVGACTNGSMNTDTTNGKLYVCEATVWVAK